MILLDTHVVLWMALEPEKLSARAMTAIAAERARNESLAIAAVTLYEVAILSRRGRVALAVSLEFFLAQIEAQFAVRQLNPAISVLAADMPRDYPKDPMDRLIGATALIEGYGLVTADKRILRSKAVTTIW